MAIAAAVIVGLVILLHVWFFVLEAVLWQKEKGLKTFRMTPEQAATTAVLAKNQGVYNLFLAAGLAWSYCLDDAAGGIAVRIFFLGCVIVAGIVGGATVSRRIFWIQSLPAIIAVALLQF